MYVPLTLTKTVRRMYALTDPNRNAVQGMHTLPDPKGGTG